MILRKIAIFGFKSFADKTELHFGEGITAVIGPNGCGKSNVVDAIRWVFGEQKTTILRSAQMQDVIFSGSEKRQPLNMAEVTLSISNNDGILPVEYSEVAITRRIFRSGESEYLLNKTQCRLRDIQDLFLDTGLGSNAYTTIENSMINRILSDKAEERRILFEEAAGIGKFKQRIRDSQRKLEKTRQDLLRINDRVQEKDRYVRMLSRQVEKANRYRRYYDDLKACEVGFEYRRYTAFRDNMEQRSAALAGLERELDALKSKTGAGESDIERMEMEALEKEKQLQLSAKDVSEASERINGIDREGLLVSQNLENLKQNVKRFEQEIASFDSQSAEKSQLLANIESSVVDRKVQIDESGVKHEAVKAELAEFDMRLQAQREALEDLQSEQLGLVHKSGEKQKDLANCQTNLRNCIELCDRDEQEIHRLEERIEDYTVSLQQCRDELQKAQQSCQTYAGTREKLLERIEHEDMRYHELVEKEKFLEAKIDSGRSKLDFLEALEASYEGYGQGIKALLEKRLAGTLGTVADLIKVEDPEKVGVVERALGSAIQTVVFKTDADLKAAMEYLRSEKVGVARMVSLQTLSSLKQRAPALVPDGSLPLRIYISTEDESRIMADYLFNRILVCDTDGGALQLQRAVEPDSFIVSSEGAVCYSNGTVIAGMKKEHAGILRRKYEIEHLVTDIKVCRKDYEAVVHDKEICIINRDEAKKALIGIDAKLNAGRQVQQEQETNIKHFEAESGSVKERIQALVPELTRSRQKIEEYRLLTKEYTLSIEEFARNTDETVKRLENAKTNLADMDKQRSAVYDHLKNIELAKQGLTSRVEQDKLSIERLKQDIGNLAESRRRKEEDKNSALSEIGNFEQRTHVLKESVQKENSGREDLQRVHGSIREEYNAFLNGIEEKRRAIKTFSRSTEEFLNNKHALEVEQTRDEEQKRAIREKIFNAYEIDFETPPAEIAIVDQEDAEVIENIQMLKERLRRIGEVNMGSIGEFDQENKELKEMVLQRDDLQTAVDDLESAIKKLNREARVQFVTTFEMVQKNFEQMFKTLFEGGEATVGLEENVDPLEAAIRINARPAGKKMRGITLLSGGERALTAISLLFALYLVKPSAYCILDELDAPLDDANINRFLKVLKTFSEKTQFIIITHNKHTMEAADVLYGVTQQESGISTIASVVLGETRQLKAA